MTRAPSPALSLATPLADVGAIPRPLAEALAKLDLTTVGRLVAHLPLRHERLEEESGAAGAVPGTNGAVRGEIVSTRPGRRGRRPRFEAVLHDGAHAIELVWFNASYLQDRLRPGMRVRVQGRVTAADGVARMVQPRIEILRENAPEPPAREARLRPVYPQGERVTSAQIERAVGTVLDDALPLIEDHLPEAIRRERGFPTMAEAYRMVHRPADEAEAGAGRARLAYDELLLLQLGVAMKRAHLRRAMRSPALAWSDAIDAHIRARLPFELTPGQDSAVREISADLARETPTNRLIQGDVGSGKTVVALHAMLLAVTSGHQAALMAPTGILAEQHLSSMSAMLSGSRVRLALLTGSTPEAERTQILGGLVGGTIDILIGTHALLTDEVRFRSLAVAVVDEQHRFGVHQRASLRGKGTSPNSTPAPVTPHTLVMTATPIPRTLAITLFGDLDITSVRGLPPGRRPIRTRAATSATRAQAYAFARRRLDAGEQVYVVTPAIDPGDDADDGGIASVRAVLAELEAGPFAGKRVAAMHGRLSRATRDAIMARFRSGDIDALVATTVIEVGVDVPNATVMVVEHADRFGLAQLHQLRGRVGRGTRESVCIVIADPTTEEGHRRLRALCEISDGFELAEKDFELRGPGELFGTRQSGLPPFRVADLVRDRDLLALARRDAAAWIDRSPTLSRPDEALVRRRLMKAHGAALGLGDVG